MDAAGWDERYTATEYIWDKGPNVFLAELTRNLPPGTVLDLAGGEGRNAVWLATRGWDATVVDFSDVGLEKARQLAADHDVAIDTVRADLAQWTPPAPVDLIVMAYLQVPLPLRRRITTTAAAHLTPGGHLLIIAHDKSNVESGFGGPPDPEVCYGVAETTDWLDTLTILKADVVERNVDVDGVTHTALDTVIMARRDV